MMNEEETAYCLKCGRQKDKNNTIQHKKGSTCFECAFDDVREGNNLEYWSDALGFEVTDSVVNFVEDFLIKEVEKNLKTKAYEDAIFLCQFGTGLPPWWAVRFYDFGIVGYLGRLQTIERTEAEIEVIKRWCENFIMFLENQAGVADWANWMGTSEKEFLQLYVNYLKRCFSTMNVLLEIRRVQEIVIIPNEKFELKQIIDSINNRTIKGICENMLEYYDDDITFIEKTRHVIQAIINEICESRGIKKASFGKDDLYEDINRLKMIKTFDKLIPALHNIRVRSNDYIHRGTDEFSITHVELMKKDDRKSVEADLRSVLRNYKIT